MTKSNSLPRIAITVLESAYKKISSQQISTTRNHNNPTLWHLSVTVTWIKKEAILSKSRHWTLIITEPKITSMVRKRRLWLILKKGATHLVQFVSSQHQWWYELVALVTWLCPTKWQLISSFWIENIFAIIQKELVAKNCDQ